MNTRALEYNIAYLMRISDFRPVGRQHVRKLLQKPRGVSQITFDFSGLTPGDIAPAFVDEVYRVFRLRNRGIAMKYKNAPRETEALITAALQFNERFGR